MSAAEAERLVDLVYRGVLRRQPDPSGAAAYLGRLARGEPVGQLLEEMIASDEYAGAELFQTQKTSRLDHYAYETDASISRFRTPEVRRLSSAIERERPLDAARLAAATISALATFDAAAPQFGGQADYLAFHRARFEELAQVVAVLLAHKTATSPILLDFGLSVNTAILKAAFPHARLHAADRPGVPRAPAIVEAQYEVDLTRADLDEVDLGVRVDVLVFAEVLEHLLASPLRVLRFLIRHLAPGGSLVLTTPNFFARKNLDQIAVRANPQPMYPENYGPDDAPHFHVREYCLNELLHIAELCGGRPSAFFFSGCWDDPQALADVRPEELQNLCVVIQRAQALGEPLA